ncbi:MAG: lysophospholipid acyltransferase family protein [Acidimicrobiales bacterium]
MAYWILKALLSPILHLFWRVRVEGREHVPARGPAVLAANHQSFCDSFFLPLVVRRRVTYVAKAEYFDNWKTAWFFRAVGQIPMRRDGGDASQRALDTATEVLNAGRLLAIYPEGTRAPDHHLHRGHTGVARLSLACDVPIIPVGIIGTRAVQPPGSNIMRPFHSVTIRFGPPVTYLHAGVSITTGRCGEASHVRAGAGIGAGIGASAEAGPGPAPAPGEREGGGDGSAKSVETRVLEQAELRALTDALMAEIARLSGQQYVDHYAEHAKRS